MLFTISDPSTANSLTAHRFFKELDYSLFLALIETSSFLKANAFLQSSGNCESSFSHAQHVTKTGCCWHFPIFTPFLWSKWHNSCTILYIYFLPLNSTKFLVTFPHSSSILKSILLFAANKIHSIILWRTSQFSSVQFSCSVVSNSLWPHRPQHARPPCPSPTPGVYSNSCPLSRWCHPTMFFLCCPLLLLPSVFPGIKVFSNESALHIRWPTYWSFRFNISPSNEHSGLISLRMDWLDLLAVQGTLKSLLQHQSSKASILQWTTSHIHVKNIFNTLASYFPDFSSLKLSHLPPGILSSSGISLSLSKPVFIQKYDSCIIFSKLFISEFLRTVSINEGLPRWH